MVEVEFSTIADNPGAYEIFNAAPLETFRIGKSIVAGHVADGNCFGPLTSAGYNIDTSISFCTFMESSAGKSSSRNAPSRPDAVHREGYFDDVSFCQDDGRQHLLTSPECEESAGFTNG
jgi:hypothetical protein